MHNKLKAAEQQQLQPARPSFQEEVVAYALKKSQKAAARHFHISQSKVRRFLEEAQDAAKAAKAANAGLQEETTIVAEEEEQKAVTGLCSMQSKIPAEECEELMRKVWDEVAEKECSGLTALPALLALRFDAIYWLSATAILIGLLAIADNLRYTPPE